MTTCAAMLCIRMAMARWSLAALAAASLASLAEAQGGMPSWDISAVAQDLDGTGNATALLLQGAQTRCTSGTFYTGMASVGICTPCSQHSYGPGYYCDDATNTVKMCPAGKYCPNSVDQPIDCPEDKWCKDGFVEPKDCRTPMVVCPKGSYRMVPGLGAIVCLIWLLIAFCCCACCIRRRAISEHDRMIKAAANVGDVSQFGEGFTHNQPSVAVEFKGLTMHLKSNKACVLKDVTGAFPAGALVALMGPSGGGKTTFMNALCGRANYGNVTGEIKINGKPGGIADFPKMVGFVPQDDIMYANLTVTQNLFFQGQLRLPAGTPYDKVMDHTTQVIKVLGLDHVAHNLIGNAEKRGLSGGQKKRVNIGMELVAMPAVIFMDEPTSGLDGAATIQLAECLSKLRKSGLTIVCVIHQPRYAVFASFSHLLLMGAGGGMVYCGECAKLEDYLMQEGFRMPPKDNPADWMIDVVCGLSVRYRNDGSVDEAFTAPDDLFKLWDEKYKGKDLTPWSAPVQLGDPIKSDRRTPNHIWQTWYLLKRCSRQFEISGLMFTLGILFFVGMVFGALISSMVTDFTYAALPGILGAGNFLFYMICTVNSRGIFGYERLEFTRDFKSGVSCSAYWLAKCIINLIPCYMYSLVFCTAYYWTMPVPAQRFGEFLNPLFMTAWYHQGLGMFLSVFFASPTAQLLGCIFFPMVLEIGFSGNLILVKDMTAIQLGLSYCAAGRWVKEATFINEILMYPEHVRNFPAVSTYMDNIQGDYDDPNRGLLVMFIQGIVLRFITLYVLFLIKNAQGGSYATQCLFVVGKFMRQFGVYVLPAPKTNDVEDAMAPSVGRRPSSNAKVTDQP